MKAVAYYIPPSKFASEGGIRAHYSAFLARWPILRQTSYQVIKTGYTDRILQDSVPDDAGNDEECMFEFESDASYDGCGDDDSDADEMLTEPLASFIDFKTSAVIFPESNSRMMAFVKDPVVFDMCRMLPDVDGSLVFNAVPGLSELDLVDVVCKFDFCTNCTIRDVHSICWWFLHKEQKLVAVVNVMCAV